MIIEDTYIPDDVPMKIIGVDTHFNGFDILIETIGLKKPIVFGVTDTPLDELDTLETPVRQLLEHFFDVLFRGKIIIVGKGTIFQRELISQFCMFHRGDEIISLASERFYSLSELQRCLEPRGVKIG